MKWFKRRKKVEIKHGFNVGPVVFIDDKGNEISNPEIICESDNKFKIKFNKPFTGRISVHGFKNEKEKY